MKSRAVPQRKVPAKAKRTTKKAAARRKVVRRGPPAPPRAPVTGAPHVDKALAYARGVIAGDIIAGRYTVLASQRMLRDLERSGSKEFPFVFDLERAEKPCRFIERLPHVKGPKARDLSLLELEPWQCFVVVNIFGWVHPKTGCRRFRKAFVEVARGNGKSFLASAIALYLLLADGEPGAEIYSAATTKDQAKIVWTVAREIVRRSRGLQKIGAEALAHSIVQHSSASKFVPLAAEDGTLDGLNPHGAVVDELHAHRTRGIYDILETALGKRDQSILFVITTAGSDRTGICFEVLTYVQDALEGKHEDDSFFGIVYAIDPEDDWRDEACWGKANPNLGVSIDIDVLRDDAKKAVRIPAAQAAFKTKRLDVWVSADKALFDYQRWLELADPRLDREKFEGNPCIFSIDLASRNDFIARVDIFPEKTEAGKLKVTVFAKHYTNEGYVESGKNTQIQGWIAQGRVHVSAGGANDLFEVRDDVLDDVTRFDVKEIGLDMFQAAAMAQEFQKHSLPVIEIPQTVKQLSEATKELQSMIIEGRVSHDGDPALASAIGNVVGKFDLKDNVFPRKDHPDKKIDSAVALIAGLSRILRGIGDWDSVYDHRGILSI